MLMLLGRCWILCKEVLMLKLSSTAMAVTVLLMGCWERQLAFRGGGDDSGGQLCRVYGEWGGCVDSQLPLTPQQECAFFN